MNLSVITSQFWSLAFQGLALGLIYSLVSLGYTMVYGVLRLINFANSEVFMLGTFAVLYVEINILGHPVTAKPLGGFELIYTLVIALVGSMIACAVIAVLVELVAYRRLRARGASRLASLISAIGVSIFLMESMRNINRVISLTFLIGGLTTGAAAFLYTTVYENTVFNVGFNMGIAAFTAAVLGGIGNIRGAFFGGLALGMIEQFASAVLGSQWKAVTVFVVLVLILLFKPNGLFGEAVQQTRT